MSVGAYRHRILVLSNDAIVMRPGVGTLPKHLEGVKRRPIEGMSDASRRRLVIVLGNCSPVPRTMITCTQSWKLRPDVKSMKSARKSILRWVKRKGGEYVWTWEFQGTGNPHLHIWTDVQCCSESQYDKELSLSAGEAWVKGGGWTGPDADKSARIGTRVEHLRSPDGAARYAAKEGSKRVQKERPEEYLRIGKAWGCSKGITIPDFGERLIETGNLAHFKYEYDGDTFSGPFKVQFGLGRQIRGG